MVKKWIINLNSPEGADYLRIWNAVAYQTISYLSDTRDKLFWVKWLNCINFTHEL